MAIIDETAGLEVQIHVNGQVVREYDDHHAEVPVKTSEKYIEAQSDAKFEIHYTFQEPFAADRAVSMIVTIDGQDVDEPITQANDLYDPRGHLSTGPVWHDGKRWITQKYRFAPLRVTECTEGPVPKDLKEKLQPVGVITCEFYFLNNPQRHPEIHFAQKGLEKLGTVDEKAVKGESLSHQTLLGESEPTEGIEYFTADYANGGEPFATFHFYYRSLSALKDLHIIERTPDPVDLLAQDDTDIGQLNRDQLEAIVLRFREEEETRLRMKRERSDSATVVGDDDDIGDRSGDCGPDFIEMHSVDLRKKRKLPRQRQMPTEDSEVIELD